MLFDPVRLCRTAVTVLVIASGFVVVQPLRASPQAKEAPASTGFLPPVEEIALPRERSVMSDLISGLVGAEDEASALGVYDAALAKLPEPTRMRGFVQLARANLFMDMDDNPRAMQAAEESVRLLPGYSAPLIAAASIYAYANEPSRGADFFLRAAEVDPATVRRVDDYEVNNILRRLRYARDERRAGAISRRLLEIGWIGSSLSSQSSLAREVIAARLQEGDVEGARALVSKLLVPAHSYSFLAVEQFRPIWADIETWAGTRLDRQWRSYLNEARQRWSASKSIGAAKDYTDALLSAGHHETIIAEILPLFSRKLDETDDQDLIFVLSSVARALAHKGRWGDVDALFARAQSIWPLESHANAINISANRGRYLLLAGHYERALKELDASIVQGNKWQVNPDALAAMHHSRACTLTELGRRQEASLAMAQALAASFPTSGASLHLCMGNQDAARKLLVKGLESPEVRGEVIAFVQKSDEPPLPSAYGRKLAARHHALISDPVLLAEIAKYGRLLPFSRNQSAPLEVK